MAQEFPSVHVKESQKALVSVHSLVHKTVREKVSRKVELQVPEMERMCLYM